MPRTITEQVYKFEELSTATQKEVLNKHREISIKYTEWYNDVISDWKEKLLNQGFEAVNEISFRGFGSQGDGASFTSEVLDLPKLFEEFITERWETLLTSREKRLYRNHKDTIKSLLSEYCEGEICRTNSRYCHAQTCDLRLYPQCYDYDNNPMETLRSFVEGIFYDWLESKRVALCEAIYKDLEAEYEYRTSDEAIKDTFEANDYEFYLNGKVWEEV